MKAFWIEGIKHESVQSEMTIQAIHGLGKNSSPDRFVCAVKIYGGFKELPNLDEIVTVENKHFVFFDRRPTFNS